MSIDTNTPSLSKLRKGASLLTGGVVLAAAAGLFAFAGHAPQPPAGMAAVAIEVPGPKLDGKVLTRRGLRSAQPVTEPTGLSGFAGQSTPSAALATDGRLMTRRGLRSEPEIMKASLNATEADQGQLLPATSRSRR